MHGLSLTVVNGSYSQVVVHGLLIEVASLVAEHRLESMQASVVADLGLQSTDSVVVVHRLSCSVAVGSNQIRDQTRVSLPLSHQGSPGLPHFEPHDSIHSLQLDVSRSNRFSGLPAI